MNTTPIKFKELSEYNDSNSCVLINTLFEEDQGWDEVNNFLSKELNFSLGKNLTGVRSIITNLGSTLERKDWLLEFDHPEIAFDCLARLNFSDLKWTSDFINNYFNQYNDNE